MKNKKSSLFAKIAIFTAIISAIIAVGVYLKKKAEDISEKLDFDGNLYYDDEDEDYFDHSEPEVQDDANDDYDESEDEMSSDYVDNETNNEDIPF